MNRKTKSEELFEEYCRQRGYYLERIPESGKPTADYRIESSGFKIIVEVAELGLNDDDHRIVKYLNTKHTAMYATIPGKRLRYALEHTQKKFRLCKSEGLACLAVIYNNTPMGDHLDPVFDIDAAMFGDQQERFYLTQEYDIHHTQNVRGGNRKLSDMNGRYVSALAVLSKPAGAASPSLCFYHNPLALIPIRPELFSNPSDSHFVKPTHPDRFIGAWAGYDAPSASRGN
ncbi:MAG TPA: hypothetical protein VL171_10625 [Verrucomicrobiae bacterium]|nr:hypothetical protein [Verrucomicrobiae bacterium]